MSLYLENKKEYFKQYYQANKDKMLKQIKDRYEIKKEEIKPKMREYSKIYHQLNKEKRNKQIAEWKKNNLHVRRVYEANRRAFKLKATPSWSNKKDIKEFYFNCPKGFEVDHIIPLKGKNVCGLHVLNNLQYLTKSENCRKRNKLLCRQF